MIQEKEIPQFENFLDLVYDLQKNPWPNQNLSKEEAFSKIVLLAQILGVNVDPKDSEFLPTMAEKIIEIYYQSPEQEAPSIPPNISELVEIHRKYKKDARDAMLSKNQLHQKFVKNFQEIILDIDPKIPERLIETMAEEAANKTIASLDPIAQPDLLAKEAEEAAFKEAEKNINEEFKKIKSNKENLEETGKKLIEEFKKIKEESVSTQKNSQSLLRQIQEIAATPEITRPFREVAKITSPVLDETLPQAILDQLAKNDGVAFLPLYTVLYPKATAAFIEKGIYTLPTNILKLAAEGTSPEWQAMINQGVFVEDFEASIKYLKEIGIPENHPLLLKLTDKAFRLKEQQKIEYKDKKGNVYYKDTPAAKILKHYYHFDKTTGRQKIYDVDLKNNLPKTAPGTDWANGGYANFIKKGFDHFRSLINTYERFSKFITKGQYTSFLTPARQFFSQKITQPIIQWLAKTAAGKAAKAGAKKAAGWIAAKLGVQAGIKAIGAAAAPETAGISLLIAFAIDVGLKILNKVKDLIIGIIKDPEKALMAIGVAMVAFIFIPMPFAIIGIIPAAFGILGLASVALTPVAITAAGAGISGFFIALTTAPIIFPIALFLIIFLVTLVILTLFIVLVVSGSFILPTKVTETNITTASQYVSDYFDITKTASINKVENETTIKIENDQIENEVTVEYTITIKPKGNYVLLGAHLEEKFTVFKESLTSITVNDSDCQFTSKEVQEAIDNNQSLKCSIKIDSRFKDSIISNSATLTTEVQNISATHKGMANAIVIVGKPPEACPKIWPVDGNINISRSPCEPLKFNGKTTIHKEAIDIPGGGKEVFATHAGEVTRAEFSGDWGKIVEIKGTCGQSFFSRYSHLSSIKVAVGDRVTPRTIIGITGSTGRSTGPHLHYEFVGLKMQCYNIPECIKNTCP